MADKRLYPISEVKPIIESSYIWKGRLAGISHYTVFNAILYVFRTGIPWRDLPPCYGNWHTIYQRFTRGAARSLWWQILMSLQRKRLLTLDIVLSGSTTFKVHRHGGGQKGGSKLREKVKPVLPLNSISV